MNKEDYVTLYLCNNDDPLCPVRKQCVPNLFLGCTHTSHEAAAVSGPCEDPWRHPDRFIRIVTDDGKTQFWERILPTRLYKYCDGDLANRNLE